MIKTLLIRTLTDLEQLCGINDSLHDVLAVIVIVIQVVDGSVLTGVTVVGEGVFLQVVRPGEALPAVVAPVFPLPGVDPKVSVELV